MSGGGSYGPRARSFPAATSAPCGVVRPLDDLLDELRGERRNVFGLAARDEPLVDDDLLVDDLRAGVPEVDADRRPGRHAPPLRDARVDQEPRTVADGADGLLVVEEPFHERDHLRLEAELVDNEWLKSELTSEADYAVLAREWRRR